MISGQLHFYLYLWYFLGVIKIFKKQERKIKKKYQYTTSFHTMHNTGEDLFIKVINKFDVAILFLVNNADEIFRLETHIFYSHCTRMASGKSHIFLQFVNSSNNCITLISVYRWTSGWLVG